LLSEYVTPIFPEVGDQFGNKDVPGVLPIFHDWIGMQGPITETNLSMRSVRVQTFSVEQNSITYYLSTKIYQIVRIVDGVLVQAQAIVAVP
jgi:hypothetical protein